jgi:hypothetical protein
MKGPPAAKAFEAPAVQFAMAVQQGDGRHRTQAGHRDVCQGMAVASIFRDIDRRWLASAR